MRSQPVPDDRLAEITRRRLELLSAEIAGARGDQLLVHLDEEPVASGDLSPAPARPGRHARRSVGRWGLLGGWLHDRLPSTLQGRVRLEPAQLGILALIVAAGLALSAWWVLRSDGTGTLVPVSSPAAASPKLLVTPSVSPTATGLVVVDVTGRVRHPGIATLPVGSRVIDALRAAGGIRPGVDVTSINRARLLLDGEQIVVGVVPPAGAAASGLGGAPGSGSLVNLNTADQATLESLPGVGPVTAGAILAWRDENGGFRSVDELLDVSGIGDSTFAELAPLVTL